MRSYGGHLEPSGSSLLDLLSTNLAREWLQIDTDLLPVITSTADEFSGGTNIDDLERLEPKIGVLVIFFAVYCHIHLKSELRRNHWEINQDNLQMKFSALNVDLTPPRSKESSARAHRIWVPT